MYSVKKKKKKKISLDFRIFITIAVFQLFKESCKTDETESVLWLEKPLRAHCQPN